VEANTKPAINQILHPEHSKITSA